MANPYDILAAGQTDEDEVIRQRYLDCIRRFPPEQCPEEFKRVREAYELIKDRDSRLVFLLFNASQGESLDELLEEERCRSSPKRPGLEALLGLLNEAR